MLEAAVHRPGSFARHNDHKGRDNRWRIDRWSSSCRPTKRGDGICRRSQRRSSLKKSVFGESDATQVRVGICIADGDALALCAMLVHSDVVGNGAVQTLAAGTSSS